MTTLSIIPALIDIFCYITLIILAITVFQIIHRMERRLPDIERKTSTTLMLTMENRLNNSVNMLNDMQRRLRILVEEEQYENAAQLRAVIKSQEQILHREIEQILADDGTVFLPVTSPTDIRLYQGHDKANKACLEHEMKVKSEK